MKNIVSVLCLLACGTASASDVTLSLAVKVDAQTSAALAQKMAEGQIWAQAASFCQNKGLSYAILIDDAVTFESLKHPVTGSERIGAFGNFDCK